MAAESSTRFRLSVWRPAQIPTIIDYHPFSGHKSGSVEFNRDWLQEEIYHWHPGQEDVWACIVKPEVSRQIRDQFVQKFTPDLPPNQRGFDAFRQSVELFRTELLDKKATAWGDTIQVVHSRLFGEANLRVNGALALLLHLEWILRVFEHVPGASVVIR